MLKKLATAIILATTLSGCVPILFGGAAIGGTGFFLNHRSGPQAKVDGHIQDLVEKKLDTAQFNNCHIDVNVFNGNVLLTGQCPSKELKMQAERLAATTSGINQLYNELTVEGPSSYLTRASDELISTRIKLNLVNREKLKSAQIQIIVQDGVVYVMAVATPAQQKEIMTLVKQISGIQKIVKIFNTPAKPVSKVSAPKAQPASSEAAPVKKQQSTTKSSAYKETKLSSNESFIHVPAAGDPNPGNSLSGP